MPAPSAVTVPAWNIAVSVPAVVIGPPLNPGPVATDVTEPPPTVLLDAAVTRPEASTVTVALVNVPAVTPDVGSRAAGSVPVVTLLALVASTVADFAKATPPRVLTVGFGNVPDRSPPAG